MNRIIPILTAFFLIPYGAGCSSGDVQNTGNESNEEINRETAGETASETSGDQNSLSIRVTVGDREFSALLCDGAAAGEFYDMLPLTLDMTELNGNEKYYRSQTQFTTDSFMPERIESGDIMLFGNSYIVLFYDSFAPEYSYTPLGRLEDAQGLAEILGDGDVTVTFERG